MKDMSERRFYFTFDHELYWSDAYQSLTRSARNLMICLYTELRWTKIKRKRRKKKFLNNGSVSFTEVEFKEQGLGCSQTYLNARNQLIEVGLIKMTYRGGMTRGDMSKYKLLFTQDIYLHERRWRKYPHENWKHEIPKRKTTMVGRETRFKKIKPTLKNHTLNGTIRPKELDPVFDNRPKELGCNT